METKKTFWFLFSRSILFLVSVLAVFVFMSVAYDIYKEQGSFDLIDFAGDDFEAIKRYLVDNMWLFIEETPKEIMALILLTSTILVYLTYSLVRNFDKIRNKVVSIYKFYKK